MLELRPDSHPRPSRLSAFDRRPARFSFSCTAIPGGKAIGAPNARLLRACWSGTLGGSVPVSGKIVTLHGTQTSLWSGSSEADSSLRRKRPEISTYKNMRLKLRLESTVTENSNSGIVGWNRTFRSAHPVNRFRMIFLHEERKQLLCNDILAKKGGGHPCAKALL